VATVTAMRDMNGTISRRKRTMVATISFIFV
jgi:hypothetical protein